MDERKGRQFAKQLGLLHTGTLGVIVEAKRNGHIHAVKEVLSKIKANGFRMSEALEKIVLRAANEE